MASYEEMGRVGQFVTDILGIAFAVFWFSIWATILGAMAVMILKVLYGAILYVF